MNALITDEMVEAGVEEIRKAKHTCFDRWTDHDAIRAVLEAGAEPALAAKDADIERLRLALKEAREMVAHWGAYASEYFQDKHDLPGDLGELDAVLAGDPDA